MARLSPNEPESETSEEAEAYDAWFRAKVELALRSDKPTIAHADVMAGLRTLIESKGRDAGRLER